MQDVFAVDRRARQQVLCFSITQNIDPMREVARVLHTTIEFQRFAASAVVQAETGACSASEVTHAAD